MYLPTLKIVNLDPNKNFEMTNENAGYVAVNIVNSPIGRRVTPPMKPRILSPSIIPKRMVSHLRSLGNHEAESEIAIMRALVIN